MSRQSAAALNLPKILREAFPDVRTVSDATKPLQIRVRPSDSARGKKKSPRACALARACRRQENADGAIVRISTAYVIKGRHATRYLVPARIGREIVSFDRHGDFAPGTYKLDAVTASERFGAKNFRRQRAGKTNGSKPRSKPRVYRQITTGIR